MSFMNAPYISIDVTYSPTIANSYRFMKSLVIENLNPYQCNLMKISIGIQNVRREMFCIII